MKLIQYALILLLSYQSLHAALRTNGSPLALVPQYDASMIDWRTTYRVTADTRVVLNVLGDNWLQICKEHLITEWNQRIKDTLLALAAKHGMCSVINILLIYGATINPPQCNWANHPLYEAVQHNKTQAVALLLKKGAAINAPDELGNTPLHHAVKNNRVDITTLLLQHGASSSIKNKLEETPLSLAQKLGHTNIVQLLTGHTPHEQ